MIDYIAVLSFLLYWRHCVGMLLSIVPIYTADGQAPAAD